MNNKEYFAYGSVLEALSLGLYPDKRHVIREFVQNSFDAILEWRKKSGEEIIMPIEIKTQVPSIFIADHGLGMDENDAQKFRYLGYSTKNGVDTAGFRGIGKDSGLAVAEKIMVTTSKYGVDKRYRVVINAQEMLDEASSKKPLEELLRENSTISEETEQIDSHYTFVELHKIKKEAVNLLDEDLLKEYLSCNCPVPFDPEFEFREEIEERLIRYVPNFTEVDIVFNGENIYKPFPQNYRSPEYQFIFSSNVADAPLIAYCWYCGHADKGQFSDKRHSGIIYRIKNFAIGDGNLTRKTLWTATPERAFYFFGEIHILDKAVIPSSDRNDFADNEARANLFAHCQTIPQAINKIAGTESEQRRFDESLVSAGKLLNERKSQLDNAEIPIEVKPELQFEMRETIKDIEKRLARTESKRQKSTEDKTLIQRSSSLVQQSKKFLAQLESDNSFVDIRQVIKLNEQAKEVYQIIVDCLKEEFSYDVSRLERIINKINEQIAQAFD